MEDTMVKPVTPSFDLQRRDLLDLEPVLCASLRKVVDFTAHGIYFPKADPAESELWLPKERKLFLPLTRGGKILAVFIAHGVNSKQAKKVIPLLPALVDLCLDNLLLHKQSRTDQLTGLTLKRELLDRIAARTDGAQFKLAPRVGEDEDPSVPLHRACVALMVIRLEGMAEISRAYGYHLADCLLAAQAEALRQVTPADCLAARTADDEFAVMLPTAARGSCEKLAAAIIHALDAVSVNCQVSGRTVRVVTCIGFVLYPQDMSGADFKPNVDIPRLLLQKARLAAAAAKDRAFASRERAGSRVMGFSGILKDGGVILDNMPLDRLFTSLGRSVGARGGMRFSIWSPSQAEAGGYIGEVKLRETGDSSSIAEIVHLNDSARPARPGDLLTLETGGAGAQNTNAVKSLIDPGTGFMNGEAFFERFARESERRQSFALAILRMERSDHQPTLDEDMAAAAEACREAMGADGFGGRHGVGSLIIFHTVSEGHTLDDLVVLYKKICSALEENGFEPAVGIAGYPFLQYHKSEIADCCRKALDYAVLLPRPRVGIFGSLAINISADRIYSGGDIFGAMEEYKLALLADDKNHMAWNSLGVCLAALSRPGEARRYFKEALAHKPSDPVAHYNFGTLCQSLNESKAAAKHFRACISSDAGHLFAHVRLGQLAEQARRLKDAHAFYSKALALNPEGQDAGRTLAMRCLARVFRKQNKDEEARALLYEILLQSPGDAAAMAMLAELFLDNDESPDMAEMLARQSVKHQPGMRAGWQALARALRALGREDDAAVAEAHLS